MSTTTSTDPLAAFRGLAQSKAAQEVLAPIQILDTDTWRGSAPPPVQWLLAGLLARKEVACLAGRSNVGKGFLVLLFMLSVATGRDMFGRKGNGNPMRVVLVEMEDAPEELHRRIHRMIDLLREDPTWTLIDEVSFWANLTIITPNWKSAESKTLSALLPTLEKDIANLTKDGAEIGLIVLDTLSALSLGDENSVDGQRDLAAAMYQLRDMTGACVLVVHHIRKPFNGGKLPSMVERLNFDYVRGSSAIVAFLRFLLQVEALTPSEAARIGLDEDKALRGGYAVMGTTKVVSGPKGDWVLLEQAEGIGGGFWIVHPRSEELCAQLHSKAAAERLSQDEAVFLSIADGLTDRGALKAKHWPGTPDKKAEMALKGVLQRLRGERHRWLEPGKSMALTDTGRVKLQQLGQPRNQHGNQAAHEHADNDE